MFLQCQNYMEPENIDIDTNIKCMSPLFAEIWDIENSHQPFCTDPTDQYNYHIRIL